jgi:hypothetical protein
MTNQELQWLLSLSVMSLLGPQFDLAILADKGFYKKYKKEELYFELNMNENIHHYRNFEKMIQSFIDDFHIEDRDSYIDKVEALINGSDFSVNMTKLLHIGRTMSNESREIRRPFVINSRLYFYDVFEIVMNFDMEWPKEGLDAYDIANGVMLLRLGVSLGYIYEEEQMTYLEKLFHKAEDVFVDYLTFGKAADVARQVDILSTEAVVNSKIVFHRQLVLEAVYLGIWKHLEAS